MIKRIGVLIATVSLLLGQSMVFADGEEVIISTRLLDKTSIDETWFNAFGVATNSKRNISSTTETRREETGKEDITSTTSTTQTVWSSWRASGLKLDSLDGNSTTTGSDGSSGSSNFWANYKDAYNAGGKLAYEDKINGGANGDDYDGDGNHTHFDSSNTYIIRNGQGLEAHTNTDSYGYGPDGTQISYTHSDTDNIYNIMGGVWVKLSAQTHDLTDGMGQQEGTSSDTWRTITYNRNANGICAGLTLEMSGVRVVQNGDTGGFDTERIANPDEDVVYTVVYDSHQGYYINYQKTTWTTDVVEPSATGNPTVATAGNLTLDLYALGLSPDAEVELVTDKAGNILQVKDSNGNVLMTFNYTDETNTKLSTVIGQGGSVLLRCNYTSGVLSTVEDMVNQTKSIYHTEGAAKGKIDKVVALSGNEVYLLFTEGVAHDSLSNAQSYTDMNYTSREVVLKQYNYDAAGNLTDVRYYTWTNGDHTNGTSARFCYRHDKFDASGKLTNQTWYNDPTHSSFEPTLIGEVVKTEGAIAGSGPEYYLKVDNGNGTFTYYLLAGRDEGADMSADYNQDGYTYGGNSAQMNAQDWESLTGKQISIQGYQVTNEHSESGLYFQGHAAEAFRVIGPITIM